jgi:hypothetical protein
MKLREFSVVQYHLRFFSDLPRWPFFVAWVGLNLILLTLNYQGIFGDKVIERWPIGPVRYLTFFLFNALPFYWTWWWHRRFSKTEPEKPGFWAVSLASLLFLALYTDFFPVNLLKPADLPWQLSELVHKLGSNGGKAFTVVLVLWIFRQIWSWKNDGFYGLGYTKVSLTPYWVLLGLMLPIVAAASFQEDFQQYYPRYKSQDAAEYLQVPFGYLAALFEFAYGMDFVAVELVFRGLFVVVLGNYMGKSAVYCMVTLYGTLHFGKPMGEAISSYFGGMILGILAYESRSILGGVFIHLGIAYLMEAFAWMQWIRNGLEN